jgi:hypothetical protein
VASSSGFPVDLRAPSTWMEVSAEAPEAVFVGWKGEVHRVDLRGGQV